MVPGYLYRRRWHDEVFSSPSCSYGYVGVLLWTVGRCSTTTLTLYSSSMRYVEERVRRTDPPLSKRDRGTGSVVKDSSYDPTQDGNRTQTRLCRGQWRVVSWLSLWSDGVCIDILWVSGRYPTTLWLCVSLMWRVSKNGYDKWSHHGVIGSRVRFSQWTSQIKTRHRVETGLKSDCTDVDDGSVLPRLFGPRGYVWTLLWVSRRYPTTLWMWTHLVWGVTKYRCDEWTLPGVGEINVMMSTVGILSNLCNKLRTVVIGVVCKIRDQSLTPWTRPCFLRETMDTGTLITISNYDPLYRLITIKVVG